LKVTLCCYYSCRDMEGVLRCIKKNGISLEHLELSRSSLLRMDPLLFRNVLTSATSLTSLVVRNVCSDAMLKLIGTHCVALQYLDIACSKQVSDAGVEALCCVVQIVDRRDNPFHHNAKPPPPTTNSGAATPSHAGQHQVSVSTAAESLISPSSRLMTAAEDPLQPRADMFVQEDFSRGPPADPGSTLINNCLRRAANVGEAVRRRLRACVAADDGEDVVQECLVEIKQVLHPICYTLKVFDIADTSVTASGLLVVLRKISNLHSLGEYCVSDRFLRGLSNVQGSTRRDLFFLSNLHTRKTSAAGMQNLVRVMPETQSLTCWEPQFDITELARLRRLQRLTLLRIAFDEGALGQILHYLEGGAPASSADSGQSSGHHHHHHRRRLGSGGSSSNGRDSPASAGGNGKCGSGTDLERLSLEFVMGEDYYRAPPRPGGRGPDEFDLSRVFGACKHLKVFTVEFKDSPVATRPVGYGAPEAGPTAGLGLAHLVHVQLGQVVQNSAVRCLLAHSPRLRHLHCNTCPDLKDADLSAWCYDAACVHSLRCFYVYEAPHLTSTSFATLSDAFPKLQRFGNLTRWAVDCEGIQLVVRHIRENNLDLEVLCGSHWFSSTCCAQVTAGDHHRSQSESTLTTDTSIIGRANGGGQWRLAGMMAD